jgi:hypothetical protein
LLSFARGYGELHFRVISQRSDSIMFQISATCTVGAMGVKVYQNPLKKPNPKEYGEVTDSVQENEREAIGAVHPRIDLALVDR